MILQAVFLLTTVIAVAASGWFVIRFHVLTCGDWRRSVMGRHVMAFTAVIGGLLALTLLRILLGDYPGRRQLVAFGFVVFTVILVHRVVLLEREQHHSDAYPPRHLRRTVTQPAVSTSADARNRAARTLAQGLVTDVILAVAAILVLALADPDFAWTRLYWAGVGLAIAKSALTAAASYIARSVMPPPPVNSRSAP